MAEDHSKDGGEDRRDGAFAERLERLEQRLAAQHRAEDARTTRPQGPSTGYAQALKLGSEFVAGVLVGAGIGWLFDRGLGTAPFGLIVFLLLGFGAGVLNVLRSQGVVAEPGDKLRRKAEAERSGRDGRDG